MADVDGPAKLHAGHQWDRGLSIVAGAPKGCRNVHESELAMYAARGHLQGGKYTTPERESAGDYYRELFEAMSKSARDSTQLEVTSRSGFDAPVTENQAAAIRTLIKIDRYLSMNDRMLVRLVCTADWTPAHAVKRIDPKYEDCVAPRFREALDSLIVAIELATSPERV
jgi:hypothetical protein